MAQPTLPDPPLQQAPIEQATGLISTNRWSQWFQLCKQIVQQLNVWVTQSLTPTSSVRFGDVLIQPSVNDAQTLSVFTAAGVRLFDISTSGMTGAMNNGAFGTGAVQGTVFGIGRNTSGSGAAGTLLLTNRSGGRVFVWQDATGAIRVGAGAPTESGSVSDLSGTIVPTSTAAGITVGPTSVSSITVQGGVVTALTP